MENKLLTVILGLCSNTARNVDFLLDFFIRPKANDRHHLASDSGIEVSAVVQEDTPDVLNFLIFLSENLRRNLIEIEFYAENLENDFDRQMLKMLKWDSVKTAEIDIGTLFQGVTGFTNMFILIKSGLESQSSSALVTGLSWSLISVMQPIIAGLKHYNMFYTEELARKYDIVLKRAPEKKGDEND